MQQKLLQMSLTYFHHFGMQYNYNSDLLKHPNQFWIKTMQPRITKNKNQIIKKKQFLGNKSGS